MVQEIRIILTNCGARNYVTFLDKTDVEYNLYGKTFKPSISTIGILCRVITEMDMKTELDLNAGIIRCTRRY